MHSLHVENQQIVYPRTNIHMLKHFLIWCFKFLIYKLIRHRWVANEQIAPPHVCLHLLEHDIYIQALVHTTHQNTIKHAHIPVKQTILIPTSFYTSMLPFNCRTVEINPPFGDHWLSERGSAGNVGGGENARCGFSEWKSHEMHFITWKMK